MQEVSDGGGGSIASTDHSLDGAQFVLQPSEGALESPSQPRLVELLSPLHQAAGVGSQVLHNAIPVSKALVAGLAGREITSETAGAPVAADARHPWAAGAVPSSTVALRLLNPTRVTVAGCQQHTRSLARPLCSST